MFITRKLFGIAILTVAVISGYGQAGSQTAKIDTYVASVKKISGSKRQPKIIVADTAEYDQKKPKWQVFASEKSLEKHRETDETYSIAYSWKKGVRIVETDFTNFSPSGDWTQYTLHYFRADGSLAKVEADLRTFYGDWIVLRNYYFDEKGKLLRKTSKYLDLTTKKPKPPDKGMIDIDSEGFKVTYFKSVDKLPFASLVK